MAITGWTGASSTAFGTVGNWTNGVPVDGDTAVFFGTPANNLTTDLAQSAIELNRLEVHSSFTGKIGVDAASPLIIDVNNSTNPRTVINGGIGSQVYLNGDQTSVWVNTAGTAKFDGGTITTLTLQKGTVSLIAGVTVTTLYVSYNTVVASNVTLTIESGATVTTAHVVGGTTTASMAPTTLNMLAGSWTQDDAGDITTLNQYGGTFTWVDSGGNTITKLNQYGGTFDGRPSYGNNTITDIDVIGPASVLYLDQTGRITVTNSPRIFAPTATVYNLKTAALYY